MDLAERQRIWRPHSRTRLQSYRPSRAHAFYATGRVGSQGTYGANRRWRVCGSGSLAGFRPTKGGNERILDCEPSFLSNLVGAINQSNHN